MASINSYPSSSSSLPIGKWAYEVFLSFRGEDTRASFVDHLYAALVKSGVYTFKDDQMLRIGKRISPELLKAIEESRSAMIIFSENYASSSWCLDELVKIMECQEMKGQRVLPVFYHVDPSDVRRQKGSFGAGFKLLEQEKFKGEPEKLEKCREALVKVSNISGFHFPKSDRGESEFIDKIVRDILQNVKPYGMEGTLIGIESHMDKLYSLLDMEETEEKLRKIEAIGLRNNEPNMPDEMVPIGANDFGRMKNLRLLYIDFKFSSHEPPLVPDELHWLYWFKYPFHSLPEGRMRRLVGLEMVNSSIQHLWEGLKILSSLKYIDLRGSQYMTKFPDLSGSPNIERLILANCKSLVEVHESLGFHRRLVYLNMSGCTKLKCLPSRIEMESLQTLILSHCVSLERFPEVSSCMVNLSNISLDHCALIKELPSSIRYITGLKSLNLMNCISMKIIPEELGSMENVRELLLGFKDEWVWGQWPEPISFHTLTSLCSLRKLDLSRRQIKAEDFPKNLHTFSLLEELHLSGNSMLTQLPTGISQLSSLKVVELNNCYRLRNLNGLPFGIQMLKAKGCSSLEKIEDLSNKCEWLYKIWLFDCHQLQVDQENERYLDKMLGQSFLKRCAIVDHRLSIGVPGSNVPSWFKEARNGCKIALRLPSKDHKQIMGFAICGVFHGSWHRQNASPKIIFKIVNDEEVLQKSNLDSSCVPSRACDESVWLSYIPFGFFQQMYHDLQPEDWAQIEGNLIMTMSILRTDGAKSVRCGAQIIFKEDLESIQQHRTCISDYGDLVPLGDDDYDEYIDYTNVSGNTYVYEEKSESNIKNLKQVSGNSSRAIVDRSMMYAQSLPLYLPYATFTRSLKH